MGMDKIIPVLFLVIVLLFIFPSFMKSNFNKKQFIINFSLWSAIVVIIIIILNIFTV